LPDFSARLENVMLKLNEISKFAQLDDVGREKISEALHETMLSELQKMLANVLEDSPTVGLLVDNLDKGWNVSSDLPLIGELLLGLLSAGLRVSEEFHRSASGRKPVAVKMIVFLRSDIFNVVYRTAPERDKLPVRRVEWGDPELLIRVIEARFASNGLVFGTRDELWDKFFPATVAAIPIRDYLNSVIFPRPRDLIVIVKACLEAAANRGHSKAAERDVIAGASQYANFAFNSIVVEGSPQIPDLEDALLNFLGGPAIYTEYELLQIVEGIKTIDIEDFIRLLVELTFFGIETAPDNFEFVNEPDRDGRIFAMALRTAERRGERRFKIHPVFHNLLSIVDS